jgi:hypothetical protein
MGIHECVTAGVCRRAPRAALLHEEAHHVLPLPGRGEQGLEAAEGAHGGHQGSRVPPAPRIAGAQARHHARQQCRILQQHYHRKNTIYQANYLVECIGI